MRQVCVSVDARRSRGASSISYPAPQVRDSEIDRFDLLRFPLLCCPSATPPPQPHPAPSRRIAAVVVVGSVLAAQESRILLGLSSAAYCQRNAPGCAALPRRPRPVRSIASMDMWQMLDKFRAEVIDSSSDEESYQSTQTLATTAASMIHEFTSNTGPEHRGSVKGRSKNLPCNRVEGQARLHEEYFHLTNPVFPEKLFRRRYRMSRDVFLIILWGVRNYDPYFQCRPDATGALGFTSYQKCSAAIRILSYGMAADIFDEYLRMGESTCLEAMYRFCRAVIAVFGEYYCREPTVENTRRLLSINESRGFPGMIGSIDCTGSGKTFHLDGRVRTAGMRREKLSFLKLSYLKIYGFGIPPRMSYEINGNAYDKPYYLADGIYPDWATLVNTVRNPNSEKTRRFTKMQEACRKDVERGFGVLQARWAIVRHPVRTWSLKTMHEVITCCVIMHNMIVENERPDGRNENHWKFQGELVAPLPKASSWHEYLHINVEVTNENVSKRLQTDLVEHQWTLAGHEDHA
ncbi:hypothetical protein QYE76_018398 [Lolium multiflorum]|uniref:DDE Tnp4 domain-containing protein n=1 Tax=Lolium multiflorum TaxID=4521 RepID=A0AAD8QGP6_LOLMU|nr:hypothetical protein QYE76_018398 [Lolium multiflorum]